MKRGIIITLALFLATCPVLAVPSGMISQVNGNAGNLAGGLTRYLCPVAGRNRAWISTEDQTSCVMPVGGRFRKFYVKLSASTGAGGTRQYTFMVNGAAPGSGLDFTISNADNGSDTTNYVDVVAGDTVSIRQIAAGILTSANSSWGIEFQANNTSEFPILGTSTTSTVTGGTIRYGSIQGDNSISSAESTAIQVIPVAGTIRDLYAWMSAAPGATKTLVFALRVNGSTSALTTTISDPSTTNTDLSNSVSVAAGDRVSILLDATNLAISPRVKFGMKFIPNTDGQSILLATAGGAVAQGSTKYTPFDGGNFAQATEPAANQLFLPATLKKLYVYLDTTVGGSGDTIDITGMLNSTPQPITCSIATGSQSCNDTTHSQAVTTGDLVNFKSVQSATTGSLNFSTGLVMEMATATPAVTSTPTATPTQTATPTITPWPTLTPLWARNVGGNQIGGHKITRKGSIWR